jgi:hypothetical protein
MRWQLLLTIYANTGGTEIKARAAKYAFLQTSPARWRGLPQGRAVQDWERLGLTRTNGAFLLGMAITRVSYC